VYYVYISRTCDTMRIYRSDNTNLYAAELLFSLDGLDNSNFFEPDLVPNDQWLDFLDLIITTNVSTDFWIRQGADIPSWTVLQEEHESGFRNTTKRPLSADP